MTREEAIWILNEDLEWAEQNRYPYISEQKQEALEIAIKALEQENVLDKIRAEIEQKIKKRPGLNHTRAERDRNDAFLEALEIIDKYREREDEE